MDLFSYLKRMPLQSLYDKNIHTLILMTTAILLISGAIIGLVFYERRKAKKARVNTGQMPDTPKQELDRIFEDPKKHAWRCAVLVAGVLFLASVSSLPAFLILRSEAIKRGCTNEKLSSYSTWELIANTQLSRPEDTLPEDLRGCVIIYYEFGNPYYNDIATDLRNATANRERVYWIDVNSRQGRRLMETYTSKKVPIAFYISTVKEDYHTFIGICGTNLDGSAFLAQDQLNSLFELQDAGK